MKKLLLLSALFLWYIQVYSQQTVGVFLNAPEAYNGYTLFAPSSSTITYLIDNCGRIVNSWESAYTPGQSVYLLENGNLLRTARIGSNFNGGGTGGRIEQFDWDGNLIWSYNYSTTTYHQHHDIEPLSNGNFLVIAWDLKTPAEAALAGRTNPNTVWSERVVEIEPIGENEINVVWEWYLWDHLVQDVNPDGANYGIVSEHPELVDINFAASQGGGPGGGADWIHFNAINYDPVRDQIVLSSRNFDEIWVIDHSTTTEEAASHSGGNAGRGGDLLYRWGNPQAYDRGTNADQTLFGQHDIQWIAEGLLDEGKMIVYNNGSGRPEGNYSTIDVFQPPYDMQGGYAIIDEEAYGPIDLDWSYSADPLNSFFSDRISGTQRLPNGNTLICEGTSGHFFEVDYDGNIVWDYISPVRQGGVIASQGDPINNNSVFRARRYGTDYAAFEGRDLTPGEPVELNPLPNDCETISSIGENWTENKPRVLNKLITDILSLEKPSIEKAEVCIFNAQGQMIWRFWMTNSYLEIPTSNWPNGFYSVRFNENKKYYTYKIIKQW